LKLPCIAVAVFLAFLIILPSVFARPCQESTQSVQSQKIVYVSQYKLIRIDITHAGHSVRMWELKRQNNTGPILPLPSFFKSLADPGLRQWVSQLPSGSGITVEFVLGGGTGIGHPLKPSQAAFYQDLHDFTKFCQSQNIEVGIIGSVF
jgi:hypothetical protein